MKFLSHSQVTFLIYDLNKILGVMKLFQDPELEVGEKTMNVGGKVKYMFPDPTMILTPPEKDLTFPDPEVSFVMSNNDFTETNCIAWCRFTSCLYSW